MTSIAHSSVPRKDVALTTIAERVNVYPQSHDNKGFCGPA